MREKFKSFVFTTSYFIVERNEIFKNDNSEIK